jgi:hypothetical protein
MRGEVKEVYAFGWIVYINGLRYLISGQGFNLISTRPYSFFSSGSCN